MVHDTTQVINSGTFSPPHQALRNGLKEQTELLSHISEELDQYFALRHMKTEE